MTMSVLRKSCSPFSPISPSSRDDCRSRHLILEYSSPARTSRGRPAPSSGPRLSRVRVPSPLEPLRDSGLGLGLDLVRSESSSTGQSSLNHQLQRLLTKHQAGTARPEREEQQQPGPGTAFARRDDQVEANRVVESPRNRGERRTLALPSTTLRQTRQVHFLPPPCPPPVSFRDRLRALPPPSSLSAATTMTTSTTSRGPLPSPPLLSTSSAQPPLSFSTSTSNERLPGPRVTGPRPLPTPPIEQQQSQSYGPPSYLHDRFYQSPPGALKAMNETPSTFFLGRVQNGLNNVQDRSIAHHALVGLPRRQPVQTHTGDSGRENVQLRKEEEYDQRTLNARTANGGVQASRFDKARSNAPALGASSSIPVTARSSIMVHNGFWDLLAATGSRFYNPLSRILPNSTASRLMMTNTTRNGLEWEDETTLGRLERDFFSMPEERDMGRCGGGDGLRKVKGVNKGMVGKPVEFAHLVHASDAEQAEALLKRWQKDGIEPAWAEPIKEATRVRARAQGVAEVQAAREDDAVQLHVVNGLPSSAFTTTTATTPTQEVSNLVLDRMTPLTPARQPAKPAEQSSTTTPFSEMGTTRFSPSPIRSPCRPDQVFFDRSENYDDEVIIHSEPSSPDLATSPEAKFVPSLMTIERAVSAKIYFETKYHAIFKKPRDRDTRRALLEKELMRLPLSDLQRSHVRAAWALSETEYLREMRTRVGVNAFVKLKTIGHGAFGVVSLVKEKGTGEVFAMKQLRKADMLRKGQEGHVRAERDLLATASTSTRWTVRLAYSFQDIDHLYLVMTYMGGGDLLSLLIERDTFEESFAKFYIAEMICAIQETHNVLGAIHRDIKPDNFLFDSKGHIAISDFGLATDFHWAHDGQYFDQQRKELLYKYGVDLEEARLRSPEPFLDPSRRNAAAEEAPGSVLTWRDRNRRRLAYSVVGTNNYMAVEVLRGQGYGVESDWWSLGVIMFEMLYGYPPFVSKNRNTTRQKIQQWRSSLRFPAKPRISREAQDLISSLICEREDRLGSRAQASASRPTSMVVQQRGGVSELGSARSRGMSVVTRDGAEEIKAHPWFRGIDFATLHLQTPPFVPELTSPTDTRYFDEDIDPNPLPAPEIAPGVPAPDTTRDPLLRHAEQGAALLDVRKDLAFQGWTYKKMKRIVYDPRRGLDLSSTPNKGEASQYRGRSTLRVAGGSGLRSLSV